MKRYFRNFDYVQFLSVAILIVLGTLAGKSSGEAREAIMFHRAWTAHLVSALIGIGCYFGLSVLNFNRFPLLASLPVYGFSLLTLGMVLFWGNGVMGARRWLWFFQPSELAKLATLLFAAGMLGNAVKRGFATAVKMVMIFAVPSLLILLEPDLGTVLVLLPAALAMLFAAAVWRKGLAVLLVASLLAVGAICEAVRLAYAPGCAPERRERIVAALPLRAHQLKRIRVFVYPESDNDGAGYNLRQSKIAIGTGGLSGKGLGKGEINRLKYLPAVVSMNDFIFCVWAEETGYLGVLGLLIVYAVLIYRLLNTAWRAKTLAGRTFAAGFATLIFAHIFVNIGMTIGLLPITGLPLPFLSAGRTFLVVLLIGLGLVQSINIGDAKADLPPKHDF